MAASVAVFVKWVRGRFRSGRRGRQQTAPKVLNIFGPDGTLLKKVEVRDAESDPEVTED
jgi:hypothetical protein